MGISIDQIASSLATAGLDDGIATAGTTSTSSTSASDAATSAFGLGQDDFMKLLLAQLQNQDPTSPMSTTDMVSQLAQFTMIQTLQSVSAALEGSRLAQASGLIGRQITGTDVNGEAVNGTVDSVQQSGSDLLLMVGSQQVKPDSVSDVTAGSTSAASATASA